MKVERYFFFKTVKLNQNLNNFLISRNPSLKLTSLLVTTTIINQEVGEEGGHMHLNTATIKAPKSAAVATH